MTNRSKKQTYEIGYGKPPVSKQFRKGVSGNPSGRPKRRSDPIDPAHLLEAIDNEEIIVMDNGRRKRMSKAEISFRQLMTKAAKGDLKAARLVVNMAQNYFAPEVQNQTFPEMIGETEAKKRYGANWQRYVDDNRGC